MEILPEFKSCGNCQNGFLVSEETDDGIAILCPCRKKYEEESKLKLILNKSGISLYIKIDGCQKSILEFDIRCYKGEKSKDNIPLILKFINKFEANFKSIHLYFYSYLNSTQKTTIAKWIGKQLIVKNFKVKFILMDELIKILQRANYIEKEDNEAEIIINECLNVDLLIIDDCFDSKKVTLYSSGYQLPFLDNFLRKRLEQLCLSTIFTSNTPINSIGEKFGISIQKLMERNTELFTFEDSVDLFDRSKLWDC